MKLYEAIISKVRPGYVFIGQYDLGWFAGFDIMISGYGIDSD